MKIIKYVIVAILSATVSFNSVSARVGENEQELVTRYGVGKPSDIQRQSGANTFKYFKNNFQIEVVLLDGNSIWEIIQKQDGDKYISDDDIKTILDGYKKPGEKWTFDRRKKLWEKSGKPKYVAYRWPGHEDYLCIKDIAVCDELDKKQTGAKGL